MAIAGDKLRLRYVDDDWIRVSRDSHDWLQALDSDTQLKLIAAK